MTRKDKKIWIKKLRPFWILRNLAYDKFRKREMEIEKVMKKMTREDLEFIYCDGEACGIGHADYNRRTGKNSFPLIHDQELEHL
jgi:hypothetical protein